MATLTPATGGFQTAGIYRIETSDEALGGETGTSNIQAKQLLANDLALKEVTDTVPGINTRVGNLETGATALSGRITAVEDRQGSAKGGRASSIGNVIKADAGKILVITSYEEIYFPNVAGTSAFVNGDKFTLLCATPTARLQRYDADPFVYNGINESVFYMYKGEKLEVWFYNGSLYAYKSNQPQFGGIIGGQITWGHNVAPDLARTGYMLCDGRTLVQNEYPELYAIVGTQYFALPSFDTFRINNSPGYAIKAR